MLPARQWLLTQLSPQSTKLYISVGGEQEGDSAERGEQHSPQHYEDSQYAGMRFDAVRNKVYQQSFRALARGQLRTPHHEKRSWSVLELGPGSLCVLGSLLAEETSGLPLRYTAVEANEKASASAQKLMRARIPGAEVLRGYSTDVGVAARVLRALDGKAPDLCFSEILGNFLSSEAFPYIMAQARVAGFVTEHTRVLPRFGATLFLPASTRRLRGRGRGERASLRGNLYLSDHCLLSKVSSRVVRLASTPGLLEFYDFQGGGEGGAGDQEHETRFVVEEAGLLDSLVCFIWVDMGVSDLVPPRRRSRGLLRAWGGEGGEGEDGCLGCVGLREELESRGVKAHLGFTSMDGTSATASNWFRPLVLLPVPVQVEAGEHVVVRACAVGAEGPGPSYTFVVETAGGVRQEVELQYARDVRPGYVRV